MTDRELLELAAKAAGIQLKPMEIKNVEHHGDDRFIGYMTDAAQWPRGWFSPLTDDGDALRLAAKLKISICFDEVESLTAEKDGIGYYEDFNGDPCVATRRAIVRAAAEIALNYLQLIGREKGDAKRFNEI